MEGDLRIVGAPPSWFDGHSVPANTHFVQPVEPAPMPGESLAAVLDGRDERPLVYVTFGTAFNTPDLFQQVFDALADVDVQVIATIGLNNDIADLSIPGNVRTVPFLSQGLILEQADLVVAHGGYGSLTGALRRGLPVLSLPLAPPDNRFNASRLVKLGAGLAIEQEERTVDAIRRSVQRLLDEPEYRVRARRAPRATRDPSGLTQPGNMTADVSARRPQPTGRPSRLRRTACVRGREPGGDPHAVGHADAGRSTTPVHAQFAQ
jgi:MGT family glycosyltransferase